MTTAIATMHEAPMTVHDVRRNINLIQEVMRSTMKDGEHYGKIPGCGDKPALFKAGAEKIMATFRLAPELSVDDLSSGDCVRYRVKCRAIGASGQFLGEGIGECSSDEAKYRWRRVVSEDEWNATDESRRRIKYGSKFNDKQARTEPADVANTVLKMAKKRALVDMTLTVTAASDIFTQDIEDVANGDEPKHEPMKAPQRKATPMTKRSQNGGDLDLGDNPISEAQGKRLYAICKSAGLANDYVKRHLSETYGYTSSKQIQRGDEYEMVCAWAEGHNEPGANDEP